MIWPTILAVGACTAATARSLWRRGLRTAGDIETTRVVVADPGLPDELDGCRLCVLADVHAGFPSRHESAITAAVQACTADVYILLGDMLRGPRGIEAYCALHRRLMPTARPVVCVFGNAEHKPHVDSNRIGEALADLGVTVLRNQNGCVHVGDGLLQIIGLDDPHTRHDDAARAYAGADPTVWTLLLSHSPDGLWGVGSRRADLALCGHTHGGQFRLPGIGPLRDATRRKLRLYAGLYDRNQVARSLRRTGAPDRTYVSRGIGTSRVPVRWNCRPELTVITLMRATVTEA